MNKFILFFFIILLVVPKLALSLSLGASPALLNMTTKDYAKIRVFNSNHNNVEVSFHSSYYKAFVDGKIKDSLYIPSDSYIVVNVKKLACKNDVLLIRFVNNSNIAPSIKVKLICQSKTSNGFDEVTPAELNRKPDPFIGMIIVLSIVALAVIIKARF